LLDDSDLIIAATGNWSAETQLDAWHAGTGRSASIIYTWTEAHACAGHAALISKRGCLRCGFNETGVPNLTVTEWPAGQTHEREPACGAVFQPYGPVELGFTINVAAELALDVLVGNDVSMPHRIWIGSLRRLREAGGVWSAAWRSDQQFRSEGNFVLERPWPAACENCAGKAAA
jgi:hypothetical protein